MKRASRHLVSGQGRHSARDRLHWGNLRWSQWYAVIPLLALAGAVVAFTYGGLAFTRFAAGCLIGLFIHHVFLLAMMQRIGPERSSVADLLTIARATAGTVLLGLVATGEH